MPNNEPTFTPDPVPPGSSADKRIKRLREDQDVLDPVECVRKHVRKPISLITDNQYDAVIQHCRPICQEIDRFDCIDLFVDLATEVEQLTRARAEDAAEIERLRGVERAAKGLVLDYDSPRNTAESFGYFVGRLRDFLSGTQSTDTNAPHERDNREDGQE